ncbi:hypothetical protein LQW54_008308 [Pestalotiopsis sp. IQ-011]
MYRKATDSLPELVRRRPAMFRAVTILSGDAGNLEGKAHSEYGVAPPSGAIVVIGPDPILGYAAPLDAASDVADDFAGFM